MLFGWDDRKAAQNVAKHGVPFDYAVRVGSFSTRTGWIPRTPAATTVRTEGSPSASLRSGFLRSPTPRGPVIRLISARKANEREQRKYNETLST